MDLHLVPIQKRHVSSDQAERFQIIRSDSIVVLALEVLILETGARENQRMKRKKGRTVRPSLCEFLLGCPTRLSFFLSLNFAWFALLRLTGLCCFEIDVLS
jgi:hypothetical protein